MRPSRSFFAKLRQFKLSTIFHCQLVVQITLFSKSTPMKHTKRVDPRAQRTKTHAKDFFSRIDPHQAVYRPKDTSKSLRIPVRPITDSIYEKQRSTAENFSRHRLYDAEGVEEYRAGSLFTRYTSTKFPGIRCLRFNLRRPPEICTRASVHSQLATFLLFPLCSREIRKSPRRSDARRGKRNNAKGKPARSASSTRGRRSSASYTTL